jgi:hypothetical protein
VTDFNLSPKAFQNLIDGVDEIIEFCLKKEENGGINSVENIDEVRKSIIGPLTKLRDVPNPSKY